MMTVHRCQASAHAGPEREPTDWSRSLLLAIISLLDEIGNAVALHAAAL